MKNNIFIFVVLSVLFLGMFYDDTQVLLIEYNNLSNRAYLSDDNIYYMERTMVKDKYDCYEDIIQEADRLSDSYIIIAKYNNANFGIYCHNYDWDIPLKYGSIFSDDQYRSYDRYYIDSSGNGIGTSYTEDSYYNMLSVPLKFDDMGFANAAFYSNVKLCDNGWDYDPYDQMDIFVDYKHMVFSCLFYLGIVMLSIIYAYDNIRKVLIHKLLGNNILKCVFEMGLEYMIIAISSFGTGLYMYYLLDPQIIVYQYTREIFIKIILGKLYVILFITLFMMGFIYLMLRYMPFKKHGLVNEYDD